jgi:integrase
VAILQVFWVWPRWLRVQGVPTGTERGFYGGLKRAKLGHKREGDNPIVFHDLRHTFGTLCAASGIPVGDIQAYMGHSDVKTTQIYMHYAPKHDAAERLTAAFGGAASLEVVETAKAV